MRTKFNSSKKLISLVTILFLGSIPFTSFSENSNISTKDFWAKATKNNSKMTGLFGEIKNNASESIRLNKVEAKGVAGKVEMHETKNGVMKMVPSGFLISKSSTLVLAPGGNHIMLMDLKKNLNPGETIEIKLNFSDGTFKNVKTVVKAYAGAQENYAPSK